MAPPQGFSMLMNDKKEKYQHQEKFSLLTKLIL